jgi:hypothetical protein
MVTGLWAAAMAQKEISKKDMVKAGKQSKAEKRIVRRTPGERDQFCPRRVYL